MSDTTDLVIRLRDHALDLEGYGGAQDLMAIEDLRHAADELERLQRRMGQINTLACYASEENTSMQPAALLEIGKLARGEDTIPWPVI